MSGRTSTAMQWPLGLVLLAACLALGRTEARKLTQAPAQSPTSGTDYVSALVTALTGNASASGRLILVRRLGTRKRVTFFSGVGHGYARTVISLIDKRTHFHNRYPPYVDARQCSCVMRMLRKHDPDSLAARQASLGCPETIYSTGPILYKTFEAAYLTLEAQSNTSEVQLGEVSARGLFNLELKQQSRFALSHTSP